MIVRNLGNTDIRVPGIAFGAWAIGGWMWGGTDDAEAIKAIHASIDEGINFIDTAPTYGMGHSERIVGQAIKDRRDRVILATKCGVRWDLDSEAEGMPTVTPEGKAVKLIRCLRPESIRYEIEQSLTRLGVDCIDLYQCHWPDLKTPVAETMQTLVDLQKEGKIREIGVSNFTCEMMDECRKIGRLATDQPKYNPLERDIETEILPYCIRHGIGVLPYSPIAQGLMTGKVGMDRTFREGDHRAGKPWFKPENRKRILTMLDHIKPIAERHNATLAQVTINWVISQPGISSALVGARDADQVKENAGALAFQLTNEEITTIRVLVEGLGAPA
ncbi:MAG: aldo/keto reductase [Candidatus Hydrogenedentota bacterium]